MEDMEKMDMGGMSMQMTFFASNHVTLFFDGWKTHNGLEMFGSCIFMIVLGIFYEGFKRIRQIIAKRSTSCSASTSGYGSVGDGASQPIVQTKIRRMSRGGHILQAFLHLIQIFLGYLLMLAFMTYNAYICISVLIGAFLGYILFGNVEESQQAMGDHCNM